MEAIHQAFHTNDKSIQSVDEEAGHVSKIKPVIGFDMDNLKSVPEKAPE